MAPEEQAFTALYRRWYGDVEQYVRRRLPDDAVRDTVAEVFLVAWRRRADLPADAVLPWLYVVARLTVANQVRGARRATSLRERVRQQPAERGDDPADRIADRLALADVFDALPATSREIVRLIAWEGLTIPEAAAVAGCSVPAATMRLHRARRQARDALGRPAPLPGNPALKPDDPAQRLTAVRVEKEDRS